MSNLFEKPSTTVSEKKKGTRSARRGLKIRRVYTKPGVDVFAAVEWDKRMSKISNPDGSTVFEMKDVEVPKGWS